MDKIQAEQAAISQLRQQFTNSISEYEFTLSDQKAAQSNDPQMPTLKLRHEGIGTEATLKLYKELIEPKLAATLGSRYWGFITGGATPAAMLADGLVGSIDQNLSTPSDSIASSVEAQTIHWLCEWFDLPPSFEGVITTGATASNLLGLIAGRQYAGKKSGVDIAKEGVKDASIDVFSALPHASSIKCMGIAGLGQAYTKVECLPDREAMDVASLERCLKQSRAAGKIVIASCGTVTTNDFDDLTEIAKLCREYDAWLHVDAAFGLFVRLLEDKKHLAAGIELADSITSDAHKWLNVPYDCGLFFCRHIQELEDSLRVSAPYLEVSSDSPVFMNRGIENSRRFRALPVWFAMNAYGKQGHTEIVKENCTCATILADWVAASSDYELMVCCTLNTVLFRRRFDGDMDKQNLQNRALLKRINETGEVFLTPGMWQGKFGFRAALSNWKITQQDVIRVTKLLERIAQKN